MSVQPIQKPYKTPTSYDGIEVHRYVTRETGVKEWDTVVISEEAQERHLAEQHLEDHEYEREKKIERLKHEIAMQRYEINEMKMEVIVNNLMLGWPT